jgi:calcineurin-like phosphoesterase family protein
MRQFVVLLLAVASAATAAQEPQIVPEIHAVRPIAPPAAPLPDESATAGISRFAFIAYGDTRCDCTADAPREDQAAHARVVEAMLASIQARRSTAAPIRFVLSSGDATFRGQNAERWNDVFTPIVEKLTKQANLPYFFSVGNHDVTGMPPGDPGRALGLHNTLTAISRLIPPEGSPRRLNGYPTYAFDFGNSFFIAFDSNIAGDTIQLAWVTDQLVHLDRVRYRNVFAMFHHPLFSSGPHSGVQPPSPVTHEREPDRLEPATLALRTLYAPLFRKHHVRMTIAGHDHLFDHFVERYLDEGEIYRRDDVVTGGGGAPIYVYAGEPDLAAYLSAGARQQVTVEHLTTPGSTPDSNPHHFVIVDVDDEKLSLEVVGAGVAFAPYHGRSRIDLNH